MFYEDEDTTIELLGVFKLKRDTFRHKSFAKRHYDSLGIRLDGEGVFRQGGRTLHVQPGDLLYCPQRSEYTLINDCDTAEEFAQRAKALFESILRKHAQ